jgi:hypothetical protein
MKAVLHGLAMLMLVGVTAVCLLVQVDHVGTALDTISARAASATR